MIYGFDLTINIKDFYFFFFFFWGWSEKWVKGVCGFMMHFFFQETKFMMGIFSIGFGFYCSIIYAIIYNIYWQFIALP